jgi:hypothetical protein
MLMGLSLGFISSLFLLVLFLNSETTLISSMISFTLLSVSHLLLLPAASTLLTKL